MTTDMIFADFNDPRAEPPPVVMPDESPPFGDIGEIRELAWTEGYVTGRQDCGDHAGDRRLTARLLTSLHDLDSTTAEAVDAAALAVADLLVNTVIAVTGEAWQGELLGRVRAVAERVKPALTVAPAFELRDAQGAVRRFGDITELSRALDAGTTGDDVTIRWQRGEATISRSALLDDVRDALLPLSAGRTIEQTARNPT